MSFELRGHGLPFHGLVCLVRKVKQREGKGKKIMKKEKIKNKREQNRKGREEERIVRREEKPEYREEIKHAGSQCHKAQYP